MSDAHRLEAHRARSDFERCIIELRNEEPPVSWAKIARLLGHSTYTIRQAWGRANAHQRGDHEDDKPLAAWRTREDATIGNEQLLRGIPVVGSVSGTIPGTKPGDAAWRLERDQRPTRRQAS